MAFPTSISAAQYSAICVSRVAVPAILTEANLKANFSGSTTAGARGDYVEIKNIRDMPAFGTPANISKVPVYGQAQTQSIGAQSDAPDLELTINFVPNDWAKLNSAFGNPNGTTAVRLAREHSPALIVMDIMMPGMAGLEACRLLKQDSRTMRIPVVMLTAKAEEVDRIVGLELGADDYVTKPFSPRELVLRIQAILRLLS